MTTSNAAAAAAATAAAATAAAATAAIFCIAATAAAAVAVFSFLGAYRVAPFTGTCASAVPVVSCWLHRRHRQRRRLC